LHQLEILAARQEIVTAVNRRLAAERDELRIVKPTTSSARADPGVARSLNGTATILSTSRTADPRRQEASQQAGGSGIYHLPRSKKPAGMWVRASYHDSNDMVEGRSNHAAHHSSYQKRIARKSAHLKFRAVVYAFLMDRFCRLPDWQTGAGRCRR
jgi:hypothetical protein